MHCKDIIRRIQYRWSVICKLSNRNWGFKYKILCKLIRSIILPCIMYCSPIWFNSQNITDLNSFLYKYYKSAIGAVLNVDSSIIHILSGFIPIDLKCRIDYMFHILKLTLNNSTGDKLKQCINNILNNQQFSNLLIIPLSL